MSERVPVLVVDDDARVRSALAGLVDSCAELRLAAAVGSAAQALALCQAMAGPDRPALALVDLLLPDAATGAALITDLRGLGVVPVALSVSGGLRERALAAGAAAFLEKDGAPDHVLAALLDAASARTAGLTSPGR